MARVILTTLLTGALMAGPAAGQDFEWPERGENLQQLPADFPGQRIRAVMSGFVRTLGVGCSYCHVGEAGQPLATYDFASDDNPMKRTAREMLAMLGSISGHLNQIEPSGERVNMWCHTCHRGRPRPQILSEAVLEVYRDGGIEAAVAEYRRLRDEFYGKGAYDFSESALNSMGYSVLRDGEATDAIEIFRLNAEFYPNSANTWDSLAEGYMTAGENELARIYYRKSLELDPTNENALEKLAELGSGD